jgi:hypothetical protein
MGAFRGLYIDIQERAENGLVEYAVVLDDDKRPATVYRVLGEVNGHFMLRHDRTGREILESSDNVWLIA